MALTPAQAGRVYDRVGHAQDWQAFYEDKAVADLLVHADLGRAGSVLEFGCGTGRLAARMLTMLPPTARYLGVDVSTRMVGLATARLAPCALRAQVRQVDGRLPLPVDDGSVDRVVSTYVFDLLEDSYAQAVLDDLRRALTADGLACLASLTFGESRVEQLVSAGWSALWRRAPRLVGGCRPIRLATVLEGAGWQLQHRHLAHAYGLVSEVVIASPAHRYNGAAPTTGRLSARPPRPAG
jgi:SAM-dependent methyltransferase